MWILQLTTWSNTASLERKPSITLNPVSPAMADNPTARTVPNGKKINGFSFSSNRPATQKGSNPHILPQQGSMSSRSKPRRQKDVLAAPPGIAQISRTHFATYNSQKVRSI